MNESVPVSLIHNKDKLSLLLELEKNKYKIYIIDGISIVDARSFFQAIVGVLPQDPPLSGTVNFDAFLDSLWGGLDSLGIKKVAFVWTKAEMLLRNSPKNFKTIIDCFNELALSVSDIDYGIKTPVLFKVFVVGNSEEFK